MKQTKEIQQRLEQEDKRFYDLFCELLPLYWKTQEEVPAKTRLILAINKWINCAMACQDIAYHCLLSKKYKKEADFYL